MATASYEKERLMRVLLCPVCLKNFKKPKVLPCGHTYCASCLQTHINRTSTKNGAQHATFPCPVCRAITAPLHPTNNVDQWVDSFPINKMHSVHTIDAGKDLSGVHPNLSFVEMCLKHSKERIGLFCTDHSTFCCNSCGFLEHRKCSNINTLDNVLEDICIPTKSKNIGTYLRQLNNQLIHITKTVKRNFDSIQREKDTILHEIRTLRVTVNAKLQKIEDDLIGCLEGNFKTEDLNFRLMEAKLNRLIAAIQSDLSQLDLMLTHGSETQKVIMLHTLDQNQNRYFKAISDYQEEINDVKFTFEVDKVFKDLVNTLTEIGTIRVSRSKPDLLPIPSRQPLSGRKAVKVSEFNVKLAEDKEVCHISDIIQLNDLRFLLVDHGNLRIKICGPDFQCQDNMTFSKHPWNVCALSDCEVAVTVPNLKIIQILALNQTMQKIRDIRTKLECWGIAAIKDQLLFTTGKDEHCILIIDKAGTDIMSIRSISYKKEHLMRPIPVVNDVMKAVLYVSYEQGEKLVAYNYACDVVFAYMNPDMKVVAGVDTDKEGNVYICGYGSHCIQQISANGRLINTMPSEKLVKKPLSIRLYRDINKFVLTYGDCDIVEIYDFCE
ncbi:hypothetical protein CHS0354_032227 [Potamilus streckersoni]|uniref:RING-type domain-containing protein n=1 Tax=Potamilus streckersoni TaxID=2493646 RepID=A0AAE0RMC7_9BIVA|nr:hypothetical protein CHS0354_032227 [Potamilus streckersoni]